jgi:hypothetical protein
MTPPPDRARHALERLRPGIDRLCRLYGALEAARPSGIVGDQAVDPTYFSLLVEFRCTLRRVGRDWNELADGPWPRAKTIRGAVLD